MPGPAAPPLEELLAHAPWVRRLARALARDADAADDLVQDACLQALRSPPPHGANLRGWIAQVLRNLGRQGTRAHDRRQRRERAHQAVRPEAAPAAALVVERAHVHQAVLAAVLGLDEPYRTAVWLRYFDELPPRAIAARLGVPAATVHTRLGRAHAQLRAHLDRAFGHRSAWLACCLPVSPVAAAAFPLILCTMKLQITVACAALAVVVTAFVLRSGAGDTASPTPDTGPAALPATVALPPADVPAPAAAHRRTEVPGPPGVSAVSTVERALRTIRGRAVDAEGRPAPGLTIGLLAGPPGAVPADEAPTDFDGRFVLRVATGEFRAVVRSAGWATVLHAFIPAEVTPTHTLVVAAPALDLAGTVRDERGQPIAGAAVRVVWPADLRARLSDNSDSSAEEVLQARTGSGGAFSLVAASVRGATLLTTAAGFVPDRQPLPATPQQALAIVLRAPTVERGSVQGQVTDQRGQPVADASVALGAVLVKSDAQGNFLLADDGRGKELIAARAGARRAVLPRPAGGFPGFVVLMLGGTPLQIHGRVLTASGAPVAGAKVWVMDATLLNDGRGPLVCEGVAAGCVSAAELMEQVRSGKLGDPERTMRDTPTAAWPWTRTGADGTFVLDGLEDRSYALRAMVEPTLLLVDQGSVAAGTRNCVIRLPADAYFPTVAGQVVDRAGAPLAGVRVFAQCDTVRVGGSTAHARSAAATTTDASGRFVFAELPRTLVYLRFESESTLPLEYGRGVPGGLLELARGDVEHLRIELRMRVHVQVELAAAGAADTLVVLDGLGARLPLNVFEGRSRTTTDALPLHEGRSPVFVVPDSAATLVLVKDGREVRRQTLALVPGEVNRLRY